MAYRIFRHPDVAQDLQGIGQLIADYAGPAIAIDKLTEIEATLHRLSDTPHIGTVRDEIFPGLRAIPTARKGVITFVVDDDQQAVFVVSITYAGADWHKAVAGRSG